MLPATPGHARGRCHAVPPDARGCTSPISRTHIRIAARVGPARAWTGRGQPPARSPVTGIGAAALPLPARLARHTGVRPVRWSRASTAWRWRQGLTWGLGLLWLLDAALQFQPYMFTRAFPNEIIRPVAAGNPLWVHGPVDWTVSLLAGHVIVFNVLFATIQLAIALGLFWRRTVKAALAGSIAWSLSVWWLGEGLGGVLTGPVSPVAGMPGAVILYALVAVLIWPAGRATDDASPQRSAAAGSPLHARGAKTAWLLLWAWFVVEALRPADRAAGGLHQLIAGMADGEPAWIAHINTTAAGFFAHRGTEASIVLAILCALIGLCVLLPAVTRPGLALAVLLALAIWVIGEDFGQLATGTATDPNTGLPLILLTLCYWPIKSGRVRPPEARKPDPPTTAGNRCASACCRGWGLTLSHPRSRRRPAVSRTSTQVKQSLEGS